MGEKKTSDVGLVFFHLYTGRGFPELDVQLRVTFPFSTGFPDSEHLGTAGGTETRGLQGGYFARLCNIISSLSTSLCNYYNYSVST